MAEERKSWLRRRVEGALTTGFNRAYTTVRVDPDKFLLQLRAGYRVPISGYHGVFSLEIHELDVVAESIIRASEGELSFYAQILGFEPGDPIPRLPLENLPA